MDTRRLARVVCRDVLFAHWPVDSDQLRPQVPHQLSLDTFDGSAWIGVLALDMVETRLGKLPVRTSMPSLNLRTYVSFDGAPGVYFISLDSSEELSAWAAQTVFQLPYYRAFQEFTHENGWIRFRSRRTESDAPPARFEARYRPPESDPFEAEPGSVEEFLIERNDFYVSKDGGGLPMTPSRAASGGTAHRDVYQGTIEHDPWPLQQPTATIEENTLFETIGMTPPETKPLFHYSRQQHMSSGPTHRLETG